MEQLIPARHRSIPEDPIFLANTQANQLKAQGQSVVNATVGALLDDQGRLVVLDTVTRLWGRLRPEQVAPYAPITGDPDFLNALVRRYWPGHDGRFSGCATPGGSGALMVSLHAFLEQGMTLLAPEPYWGPYGTLASENGVFIRSLPFPHPGERLDIRTWRETAREVIARQRRLLIWLNEPCHNPTGTGLCMEDRHLLNALLEELSQEGPVTLLLDAAYLDYAADPLAVRTALDLWAGWGRTGRFLVGVSLSLSKSLTLYGARCGALVFPWVQSDQLQKALGQICRGMFSTSPRAPQEVEKMLAGDMAAQRDLLAEHRHWSGVLAARARALDSALVERGRTPCGWTGGFFVTLPAESPKEVQERMKGEGVFVVATQGGVRVGICGLKACDAPRLAMAYKRAQ